MKAKERAAWLRVEAALEAGKSLRVPFRFDKQTGMPIRFRTLLPEHFRITRDGYRAIKGTYYLSFEWDNNRAAEIEKLAHCLETGEVYTG